MVKGAVIHQGDAARTIRLRLAIHFQTGNTTAYFPAGFSTFISYLDVFTW